MKRLMLFLIRFYRNKISPMFPPRYHHGGNGEDRLLYRRKRGQPHPGGGFRSDLRRHEGAAG